MAIYRNQAGQKIAVFAYTPADGAAKTGDAASITAYLSKDWGAAAALADTNPTELDATNMPGWYVFDLAQTETDAEVLIVAPKSATAGVVLDQVQVFTLDATISSRAPAATALANTIWTDGRAALLDYLDAAISSRLAGTSYTAPDNAGITTLLDRLTAARAGYLDKLNVSGALAHSDAADTYKADVSALATEATVQEVKAKTDQLSFTTPNKVDAMAEATVDTGAIADAVTDALADNLAGDIWSHTPRTLTQVGVIPDSTTTAAVITRRRGDDWSVTIEGLNLAGYQKLWFTIKKRDTEPDAKARLRVTDVNGLECLNGRPPHDTTQAALTATESAVTITVKAAATAQLPAEDHLYDVQGMDADGAIYTVSMGTFIIQADVTRATS